MLIRLLVPAFSHNKSSSYAWRLINTSSFVLIYFEVYEQDTEFLIFLVRFTVVVSSLGQMKIKLFIDWLI